jgi:hypothetical protein
MGFRVVDVQPTPNPNAMKFMLDRDVSAAPTSFFSRDAAKGFELAERLFDVNGVTSLLFLGDFLTVNKSADAKWPAIKAAVTKVLAAADKGV